MKLLLSSAGIKNASIDDALVDLLGKPISESSALCIPTASTGTLVRARREGVAVISGQEPGCPMCELGWKSLGVLELTALPSIDENAGSPVEETDVLLVRRRCPIPGPLDAAVGAGSSCRRWTRRSGWD